ncbi:MAG TPA: hypothetical protein VE783_13680 [Candidatus Limnocylindrales bacterium]|nr:hypothetical protein [Candidatus Limnocylindrales bacterium]
MSPRIEVVPQSQGAIIFTSARALNNTDAANAATNIWAMNSDGTNAHGLTQLTATGASSADPVWSPDGKKIAYTSMRALDGSNAPIGAVNIWVMNADGSGSVPLTRLTTTLVSSIHANWSPDSSKIAYDSTRALEGYNMIGATTNIWVVNADGTSPAALTTLRFAPSVFPVWSPDGTKILFTSSRSIAGLDIEMGINNIWVMNADGSNPQPLTKSRITPSSQVAWSPDAKKIAFVSTRALNLSDVDIGAANLWVMNSDGSSPTPLTHLSGPYNMIPDSPVWSPDGSKLVYVSSRALDGSSAGGTVLNVWVINSDGSADHPVTALTAAKSYEPSWSSDGSKIIYCSTRALDGTNSLNTNVTWNIWMNPSTGGPGTALTRSTAAAADSAGPQWDH